MAVILRISKNGKKKIRTAHFEPSLFSFFLISSAFSCRSAKYRCSAAFLAALASSRLSNNPKLICLLPMLMYARYRPFLVKATPVTPVLLFLFVFLPNPAYFVPTCCFRTATLIFLPFASAWLSPSVRLHPHDSDVPLIRVWAATHLSLPHTHWQRKYALLSFGWSPRLNTVQYPILSPGLMP